LEDEPIRCEVIKSDCEKFLCATKEKFDLTFLDPPFNQGKDYESHHDAMAPKAYWDWMKRICKLVNRHTTQGGGIYFMQREKNVRFVLETLQKTNWTFQNLIIWKKKTSAVPCERKFGLHYQIIAFATKGESPRVFNKLRIDPPHLVTEKYTRPNGMFVTDVWDDIRELTSGYYAGDEPLRLPNGERAHKQQSPIQLLARIIMSSSKVNDLVFDPFAGTGTTLITAKQLKRKALGTELDGANIRLIEDRIRNLRRSDNIEAFRDDYIHTQNLETIWPSLKGLPKLDSFPTID
jgi:DNA modification methylase